jgi:hypothetical protein
MTTQEKRFIRREIINHWIVCGYPLSYLIHKVRHYEYAVYEQNLNIY